MGLVPLAPVVSKVIQDKKAHSELQIIDYSDDSSPVEGVYNIDTKKIVNFIVYGLICYYGKTNIFCLFLRWKEDTALLRKSGQERH